MPSMECMRIHTVDHKREGQGYAYSKTHYVHARLPERPTCWLLGHKPVVHISKSSYSSARWIECERCSRRPSALNSRTWGLERDGVAVNWDGLLTEAGSWDERDLDSHVQVVLRKPQPEFSLRLHFGGRGSETPIDAHCSVLGSGAYLGLGVGEKVAEAVGPRRDLKVHLFNGHLYWRLWTREDYAGRSQRYPRWREGSISASPLDHIFGPRRYSYEDVDKREAVLIMGDGEVHPVTLTLQRQSLGRKGLPKRAKKAWCVDWEAPQGIPTHVNRDWRGNKVYGSGFEIDPFAADADVEGVIWIETALVKLRDWVLAERHRNGWTKENA